MPRGVVHVDRPREERTACGTTAFSVIGLFAKLLHVARRRIRRRALMLRVRLLLIALTAARAAAEEAENPYKNDADSSQVAIFPAFALA